MLEWLRNLAEESKAKRLAIKQQQAEQERQHQQQNPQQLGNSITAPTMNTNRDSLIFRKTLVGYQGDLPKSASTKIEMNKSITQETVDVTTTPNRPLTSSKETSSNIKSILKKKTTENQQKPSVSKPNAAKSLRMMEIGTPIRFSAYARQQMKLGLPLPPKEVRYERAGQNITGPLSPKQLQTNEAKSVKWADTNLKAVKSLFFLIYRRNDRRVRS